MRTVRKMSKHNMEILIDPKFAGDTFEVDLSKKVRCPFCGQLLFKGKMGKKTAIEIKCANRNCKKFIRINKM